MLVLMRKEGESVRVGDDITLVIVRIGDDRVRIGIEAPRDMPVHRAEVYEAIQRDAEAERIRRENNPSRGPLP